MKNPKPLCSMSLDLDNQWSYMKIHGDSGWDKYPTYLDSFVPHVVDLLDQLNLSITFFVVGLDAADERNFEYLKEIPEHGHEVGNHSYNHESWFHLYSKEKIEEELTLTENSIEKITGNRPIGFRGPGFSWSKNLFLQLKQRGYLYDASTLPTYIGPLARMYYFRTANLSSEEREERAELFGVFKDGFRKIKPYKWALRDNLELLEIPVSTIPIFKFPFHLSYLHYLARFSQKLMMLYLQFAIKMCKLTNIEPSFLLHPLDLIGGDKVPELAFFPGMDLSSEYKKEIFEIVITQLSANFNLVNMSTHADNIINSEYSKPLITI